MSLTSGWISKFRVKSVSVWISYGFRDSLGLLVLNARLINIQMDVSKDSGVNEWRWHETNFIFLLTCPQVVVGVCMCLEHCSDRYIPCSPCCTYS
jgi:hypothetical protein